MAPSKLTDADKQQIIHLYRQPGETTLTLAHRYGVSNTTISRILKSSLPADEYEALIQQKRSERGGMDSHSAQSDLLADLDSVAQPDVPPIQLELPPRLEPQPEVAISAAEFASAAAEPETSGNSRRVRRRSSAPTQSEQTTETEIASSLAAESPALEMPLSLAAAISPPMADIASTSAVETMLDEDLLAQEDLDDEDEDDEDDIDDLDDDLDDDEDDDLDGDEGEAALPVTLKIRAVQVLPLAEATIPSTCYLVVDRAAELVARPLREFGDLGQIPSAEIQEKTLPVFDNHRVARRFSNHRTQRVIKVPDGRVLQKASSYLQAKGITRLLIDGQVYTLNGDED